MPTVAITGAGRGLGLELVKQHAARGDRILALLRAPETAQELKALAERSEARITLHPMDVAHDESVRSGATAAIAALDEEQSRQIDVLYNVAGLGGSRSIELEKADFDEWRDVLNVNVIGPMRVIQAFLPALVPGGKVVNFGSQMGASTWHNPGSEIYCTSKAALHKLTQQVALDSREIHGPDKALIAISVHPGWVQTDMGGANADITVTQSITGIVALTDKLTPQMSGGFYKWTGEPHAW